MSSLLYPNSVSISLVCCPKVGGAVRISPGVLDNLIGIPVTLTFPDVGC